MPLQLIVLGYLLSHAMVNGEGGMSEGTSCSQPPVTTAVLTTPSPQPTSSHPPTPTTLSPPSGGGKPTPGGGGGGGGKPTPGGGGGGKPTPRGGGGGGEPTPGGGGGGGGKPTPGGGGGGGGEGTCETDWGLRLVNGATQFEGILDICTENNWRRLVVYEWEDASAAVACRELGFTGGGRVICHLKGCVN